MKTESKLGNPGFSSRAAAFVKLANILASTNGPGIYKSPFHFTAVQQAATAIDLSGQPSIINVSQFIGVVQIATTGDVTYHVPSLASAFSWDATNNRITVAGATFAATDVFGVIIAGPDRFGNHPGNFLNTADVLPYPLRSDSAAIPLITAPQTFTAAWADLGNEIPLFGWNKLKLWFTFDINDSTDLRVRIVEKHESGGAEEFPSILETYNAADVRFQPGYWELEVDADTLAPLIFDADGMTPYGQVQIMAGTLGAGTDAQMDAAGYTRGAFGG